MPSTPRFAYIDSLRAVAALLVVWTHGSEQFVTAAPDITGRWMAEMLPWVDLGRMGVVAFFGISGYVIPASFDARDPRAARTFLVRRFFRLYPAYWLSVLAALLINWPILGQHMDARTLLLNLTMLPETFGAKPAIGLYWTLAYELLFYAICLGLCFAGLLQRPLTMAILSLAGFGLTAGLIVAAIYTQVPAFGGYGLVAFGMSAMFLGALWRRWTEDQVTGWIEKASLLAVLLGVLVLLPAACLALIFIKHVQDKYFIWLPVSYGGGIALFLAMTSFARVNWRPLAWVGLVSYALYLFHPVVLYPMRAWLVGLGLPHLNLPLAVLGLAIAATALAAGVFYGLERPSIALGRRLSRPATVQITP